MKIFRILNPEILNTTNSFDHFPKTKAEEPVFLGEYDRSKYEVLVAKSQDENGRNRILRYGRLTPHSSKDAYSITANSTVYVDHERKRMEIGKLLLVALIEHARAVGIRVLIAVITDENQNSIKFHEKIGFDDSRLLGS